MVFDLIARLVNRHGWLVLVCWVALAAALRSLAPSWDEVSLDDDVHFFPPGSLSVDRPGPAGARLPRGRPTRPPSSSPSGPTAP